MTWWITVAAVRIQSWIQQTPQLAHMRGASKALRSVTSPSQVGSLPGLGAVRISAAESSVDGVVVATAPSRDEAAGAASALATHLGHELPGVQWEAWWAEAETYLAAYSRAADPFEGVPRLRRLPALQECGLVKSCLMCRSEPGQTGAEGSASGVLDDDDRRAVLTQGNGCRVRLTQSGESKDAMRLREDEWALLPGERFARDFDHLARRGGLTATQVDPAKPGPSLGRKESRNHLATICADGNSVGAFFKGLATSTLPLQTVHAGAIRALNNSTWSAVNFAARTVAAAPDVVAIEPHFIGGDDVLVSVPAPLGWSFASHLARCFEDDLRQAFTTLLATDMAGRSLSAAQAEEAAALQKRIGELSLGIGMTFSHASFPFAEAHEVAEAAQHAAKQAGKGVASMIGWADITAQHSDRGGTTIHVIDAEVARSEVAIASGDVGARPVFRLSPSARAQLTAILRDTPDHAEATVQAWAERLEDGTLAADLAKTPPERLREDLSRARWWPNTNLENDR
jgi:hypothetical protein